MRGHAVAAAIDLTMRQTVRAPHPLFLPDMYRAANSAPALVCAAESRSLQGTLADRGVVAAMLPRDGLGESGIIRCGWLGATAMG